MSVFISFYEGIHHVLHEIRWMVRNGNKIFFLDFLNDINKSAESIKVKSFSMTNSFLNYHYAYDPLSSRVAISFFYPGVDIFSKLIVKMALRWCFLRIRLV